MLEHCPICKSDDRARVGAKKDGMDRRKENETKTIVGCDLAEGEIYLRPETCKVEDRFAPTFYYVPNALRSLPTFRETRARQLLAEIEYFQRHFPLLLSSAAGREKKRRSEVSLLTRVTEVSSRLLSSLVSALPNNLFFVHDARRLRCHTTRLFHEIIFFVHIQYVFKAL